MPLVIGADGRRLAKRHGDTRLAYYRDRGVTPGRMRALLARWCGVDCRDEISLDEFTGRFEIGRVPRNPIVFTEADDAWLLTGKTDL